VSLATFVQVRESEDREVEPDLRLLFHRLNNQLGVVLANAELLASRELDAAERARAEQLVGSILDAMGTTREIRRQTDLLESRRVN
jgi:hypothetical protein